MEQLQQPHQIVVERKWQWKGGKGCTLDAISRIRIRMGEEIGRQWVTCI